MITVTSSVWRVWRSPDTETDISLLVKAKLPAGELFDRVRSACERADMRDVNGDDLAEFFVAPVAKGVAVWVANCEDLSPVVDRLVTEFETSGLDGATITTLPIVDPGLPLENMHYLKCEWAMRGSPVFYPREVNPARPPTVSHWEVEPADLATAVEFLLSWAFALTGCPDVVPFSTGAPFTSAPKAQLVSILRAVVGRLKRWSSVVVVVRADDRFRVVSLKPGSAYATATEGSLEESHLAWHETLHRLTQLLVSAPDWARSGYITRGSTWGAAKVDIRVHASDWVLPAGVPQAAAARHAVEAEHLLDALGVFMRRDGPDLSTLDPQHWQTSSHDGTTLVEHRNPAAWYAHPTMDPNVREQARRSLLPFLPAVS